MSEVCRISLPYRRPLGRILERLRCVLFILSVFAVATAWLLEAPAVVSSLGFQLSTVSATKCAPGIRPLFTNNSLAPSFLISSAATAVPAPPPLKLEEKDLPGLAVTFLPAGSEGKLEAGDTRVSRLAALYVQSGSPPASFIDGGKFTAVFEGAVNMRLRDTYTFSAEGRGTVSVTVNDKEVLKATGGDFSNAVGEAIRLNKGKNKITIRYQSPDAGDAAFRLLWTVKGETYADPVPPTVLTHDGGAEPVAKGERLRAGRMLLADFRCTRCHSTPLSAVAFSGGATLGTLTPRGLMMPELGMDAPELTDLGARLNKDWMTVWINNPHSLRPNPHMPRLFKPSGDDKEAIDARAADIAAYLATLGWPPASVPAPDVGEEKLARGGQLFAMLNCIACHQQPGAQDAPAPDAAAEKASDDAPPPARVPLKNVKAKFKPAALVEFLLKPSTHYQWIPMPNFRFAKEDAEALGAFLLSEASGELPANLPAGDAAKGKLVLESSGCLNCHAAGDARSALKATALNDIATEGWSRGCLAADDSGRKTAPVYELTEAQRQAIVAFAATDRSSLGRDPPAEFAERQIKAMNCAGCHARDGKESLLATLYDAEAKELEQKYPAPKGETAEAFAPDQRAPMMTWFGEKLHGDWMMNFIAGDIPYKPRPYLHARMPAFAARAAGLAEGMASEHGIAMAEPLNPKPDAAMAAIGSKLTGKTPNQAFSCTQCHAVQKQPPFAPFEAPAVNFMHVSERIRKDYFHRWVHNPQKIDPNTKMPAFERDDGKTTILGVYDGDAYKQFEAIWQYLLDGNEIKPPVE